MTRKITNRLIAFVEDGAMTWETIARAALAYMSEDEVADMAHCNDLINDDNEDDQC